MSERENSLMDITILYYGQARLRAGRERDTVAVPASATARDAIARAVELRGPELKKLLFAEDGTLRKSALITVNGTAIEDHAESVEPNAEIGVFPALAGG